MRRSCSAEIKASDSYVCSVLGLAVHACDPSVCETAEVKSGLGFRCFSVEEEEVQDGRAVRKEQMGSYRTRLVTKTHFSGHWHWRKAKGRCSGRRQAQAYSLIYMAATAQRGW